MKDLSRILKNRICAEGGETKLVEMGGRLVGQGLSKPVSFRGHNGCVFGPPECNIEEENHCSDSRVVYEIRCDNCNDARVAKYIGTSGFSTHKRMIEHQKEIRSKRQSNSLYKHHEMNHTDLEPRFKSKPLRRGIKFNLDRYITEALLIEEANMDPNVDLLNNRSEWGQRGVPRVRFDA